MTPDATILIVGGGPAGLSTWLHLHAVAPALARRTVLIEKERYPRDKLCGGGITMLGDLLLGGLGVTLECPSVPIRRIDVRVGDTRHSLDQPGALRVVRRHEFDHALAGVAVRRGLELREGEAFIAMRREADHVRVQTTRAELTARVVVAADGAQSTVRRSLRLGDEMRLARLIEIVAPVDPRADSTFDTGAAIFDFSPMAEGVQGYIWHFPCLDGGRPSVNRGIYDSRLHPERARADLRAVFGRALVAAGIDPAVAEWRSHPLRWFGPPGTLAVPNILLVGDAAGVDPLLGEGIAPSLDYGDLAAHLLVDAFARDDCSFCASAATAARHPLLSLLAQRGAIANAVYGAGVPPRSAGAMIMRALLDPSGGPALRAP